jgi:hypothetical protein
MPKEFRYCAAALVLVVAAIAPAAAQFAPTPDAQQTSPPGQQTSPPVGKSKGKKAALTPAPSIAGSWTGTLTQVGNETPYQFEMAITTNSVETNRKAHPRRVR